MFCSKCGCELQENENFCHKCGTQIGLLERNNQTIRETQVNKCPNCGEIVNAFDLICPSCGFEFRNKDNSSQLKEFFNSLNEVNDGSLNSIKKRMLLVQSAPIPNSKEGIIEFMLMASSNIDDSILSKGSCPSEMKDEEFVNLRLLSQAWISKMEQAYQKAELMLRNDESIIQIKSLYNKKISSVKKARIKSFVTSIGFILFAWIIIGFALLFIIGYFFGD